jgi:hypothetical protein
MSPSTLEPTLIEGQRLFRRSAGVEGRYGDRYLRVWLLC